MEVGPAGGGKNVPGVSDDVGANAAPAGALPLEKEEAVACESGAAWWQLVLRFQGSADAASMRSATFKWAST